MIVSCNLNEVSSELQNVSGIYCIRNQITGKFYVGYSHYLRKRALAHRLDSIKGIHDNKYLQASINKHGIENFVFCVLEFCPSELLHIREQYWVDFYKSYDRNFGYNFGECAANPFLGQRHEQYVKDAVAASNKRRVWTDDARNGVRMAHKGKKLSDERRLKMSEYSLVSHEKEKKKVILVNPNGDIIEIIGLRAFCRQFNFRRASIRDLITKKIQHYKGWKLFTP